MKTLKQKLIELNACSDAIEWVRDMSLKEAWNKCERGDWMLWLAFIMKDKLGWSDIKQITLAKVKCARLVQHLMKDERSLKALDIAEKWAKNEATDKELKAAAYAAYDAYAGAVAAYAAYAAAYAAYGADADATSASAVAVAADATDARKDTLKQCADICREILKIGKI
jgi:hypothetical protein